MHFVLFIAAMHENPGGVTPLIKVIKLNGCRTAMESPVRPTPPSVKNPGGGCSAGLCRTCNGWPEPGQKNESAAYSPPDLFKIQKAAIRFVLFLHQLPYFCRP